MRPVPSVRPGLLESTADPERYEFQVAYVTPDGRWRFPADLGRAAIAAAEPMPFAEAVARLVALEVDVAMPQMFCLPGMTYYRGLFDLLDIPYVGNPPDVMALTMHKAKAKAVVAAAGVGVPAGEMLRRGDRPSIDPPVVIKPAGRRQLARPHPGEGPRRLRRCAGDRLRSFRRRPGRDLHRARPRGQVRNRRPGRSSSCACRSRSTTGRRAEPVRSHEDKLSAETGSGELQLVAKDSSKAWIVDVRDPLTDRVWHVARKCHVALGCRQYSLFDFRIDPAGQPWFLEAGLYCSFARQSVIPTMAGASGVDPGELFSRALRNVLG